MWSVDSSLSLQRLHLLTMDQPLFINMSVVKIFPQTASQEERRVLRGAHDPQISLARNNKLLSALTEL